MCEQTQMEVQKEIDQQFTLKDKFFKELEKKDLEIRTLREENEHLLFKYQNGQKMVENAKKIHEDQQKSLAMTIQQNAQNA